MRKAFRGLFRSVTRVDVFWFWGNIKRLLEIWEASVVLCASAEEAA